jgi:hypothetical protein
VKKRKRNREKEKEEQRGVRKGKGETVEETRIKEIQKIK